MVPRSLLGVRNDGAPFPEPAAHALGDGNGGRSAHLPFRAAFGGCLWLAPGDEPSRYQRSSAGNAFPLERDDLEESSG